MPLGSSFGDRGPKVVDHAPREAVERARDMMTHRGPDGFGYAELCDGRVVLAHRRLAVLDPSPAGAQPMVGYGRAGWRAGWRANWRAGTKSSNQAPNTSNPGTNPCTNASAIVYNGEIYNDQHVRSQLINAGGLFETRCDTETLLTALDAWGIDGLDALRGMFAFVHVDATRNRAILARDPMGVKPLYWWRGVSYFQGEPRAVVVAASEVVPLVEVAKRFGYSPLPDMVTVSSYLTTIRTTLGTRTMLEGVQTIEPGAWIEFDLATTTLEERTGWHGWFRPGADHAGSGGHVSDPSACAAVLDESVSVHMRSDVSLCALLSGGIDSAAIVALAQRSLGTGNDGGMDFGQPGGRVSGRDPSHVLKTFCSGARAADSANCEADDFAWASTVANELGTQHTEVPIDRATFISSWRKLVMGSGVPMSTPNETAIYSVSSAIRAAGHVVTLSGEGADEILGGYDLSLRTLVQEEISGAAWTRNSASRAARLAGIASWLPLDLKEGVLREGLWERAGNDQELIESYAREWELWCGGNGGRKGGGKDRTHDADSATRANLRFLQRINLHGLLLRLDQSTMRAGVEGRTPFADIGVARWAHGLSSASTFDARHQGVGATKRALREAFATIMQRENGKECGQGSDSLAAMHTSQASHAAMVQGVRTRAKASFPLPFQAWVGDMRDLLLTSRVARDFFSESALGLVGSDPTKAWTLAWPMANVTLWAERWWGSALATGSDASIAQSASNT